jgi:hypothetical protein
MPSKGKSLYCGERSNIVDKSAFLKFRRENPEMKEMSFTDFNHLCADANLIISEVILKEPLGFKLPYFGHICVNRYKSANKSVDASTSKLTGKKIPHTNMHTLGYRFAIRFLKVSESIQNNLIRNYAFRADRKLKRKLAAQLKETGGENFLNLKTNHFVTKTAINKYILNKF